MTTAPDAVTVDGVLARLDAWWRTADRLSVGQVDPHGDPLPRRPLRREDITPWLLGHWGTTPGLNLLDPHLDGCGEAGTNAGVGQVSIAGCTGGDNE